jgi:soluble lytic murein transglycosylase
MQKAETLKTRFHIAKQSGSKTPLFPVATLSAAVLAFTVFNCVPGMSGPSPLAWSQAKLGTLDVSLLPLADIDRNELLAMISRISSEEIEGDAMIRKVLAKADAETYRELFDSARENHLQPSVLEGQKVNPLLKGHVLATMYLNQDAAPTYAELTAWLETYSELPQAADVYTLAQSVKSAADTATPALPRRASLRGYGAGFAEGDWPSEAQQERVAGLSSWRDEKLEDAARHFSAIADNAAAPPSAVSFGAFWAARAYEALGDKEQAAHYLRTASHEGRTFYGLMASNRLGIHMSVDKQAISLHSGDAEALYSEPAVKRAVALMQVGQPDLAEAELRQLFPQMSREEQVNLLALAGALRLPSLQIAMATNLAYAGKMYDTALYPVPRWQPHNGFNVDQALIFAIARQESGFRPQATSPDGARGVMQIMPATASLMEGIAGVDNVAAQASQLLHASLHEPEYNMTIGQRYVAYLMEQPSVSNNLFYMLASYNAGPGKVIEWQHNMQGEDPLLFVETIPYTETRNYVMRVMSSYWIYSELMGGKTTSLAEASHGKSPMYRGPLPDELATTAHTSTTALRVAQAN